MNGVVLLSKYKTERVVLLESWKCSTILRYVMGIGCRDIFLIIVYVIYWNDIPIDALLSRENLIRSRMPLYFHAPLDSHPHHLHQLSFDLHVVPRVVFWLLQGTVRVYRLNSLFYKLGSPLSGPSSIQKLILSILWCSVANRLFWFELLKYTFRFGNLVNNLGVVCCECFLVLLTFIRLLLSSSLFWGMYIEICTRVRHLTLVILYLHRYFS